MQSSTSAFNSWDSIIKTRDCSSRKGPRSTVFSLFNKIVIRPFKISCFALLFTTWRKHGNISSVICMSIVVSHAWGWSDWVKGEARKPPTLTVCREPAVLGWSVDVSSIIFVELVCKVQLNIEFNRLRVPDFQRHSNGNSCLLCFSMTCKHWSLETNLTIAFMLWEDE